LIKAPRLNRFVLFLILSISLFPAMSDAREKSLAATYGPSDQVLLSLNWKKFGLYGQPILSYQKSDFQTTLELGARSGIFLTYTAFSFREMECRLQAGIGGHSAVRNETRKDPYQDGEIESETRQSAGEIWIQPEFRFYQRFALVLEAQVLRYVFIDDDDLDFHSENAHFDTPDLSLSELRIGLRYYLPFGR
jgi:hypothetical protein